MIYDIAALVMAVMILALTWSAGYTCARSVWRNKMHAARIDGYNEGYRDGENAAWEAENMGD